MFAVTFCFTGELVLPESPQGARHGENILPTLEEDPGKKIAQRDV
jgi:hypothetical protein